MRRRRGFKELVKARDNFVEYGFGGLRVGRREGGVDVKRKASSYYSFPWSYLPSIKNNVLGSKIVEFGVFEKFGEFDSEEEEEREWKEFFHKE
jgi:hypothetical protein